MRPENKTEVGHILRSISQKEIGIKHHRLAIDTLSESVIKDMDSIWKIIDKENGNEIPTN